MRLTVSILFKYLRKDLDDAKLIKDLKIWLDRAVGVGMIFCGLIFILSIKTLR